MKSVDLHQVDSFTKTLFGGNPAGVVTSAEGMSDEDMKHIAREMNLSETAFVLSPTRAGADIKLRYFGPGEDEVKFCGHATVGTLYELARLGLHGLGKEGRQEIRVETNAGVLDMWVESGADGDIQVTFTAPKISLVKYDLQGADFATKMGISADDIKSGGHVLIDTELKYIYVPVVSLDRLGKLAFDFTRMRQNFAAEEIVVFCLYTGETFNKSAQLHARGLAPLVGVDEDPFTGSMQAALFESAKQNGVLPDDATEAMVEQGYFIGRPGIAKTTQTGSGTHVTGSGVHVFSTKLELY